MTTDDNNCDVHVAVTGVTGYIGSHVTALLLKKGYIVHGTVRKSSNKPERLAFLHDLAAAAADGALGADDTPPAEQRLRIFEADLLDEGSFDAATRGCRYVLHVASPWKMDVADAHRDLIAPAVSGTLNVLRSCASNGVSKVVLTSSDASLSDGGERECAVDAHARAAWRQKVFTEDDWNTHSSPDFMPYYYSKAAAERAAWAFAKERGLNLVAINPPGVFGPSLTPAVNESAALLLALANADPPRLLVDLSLAVVDVRDVAAAHVRAMESGSARGRYVCCPPRPMVHVRKVARLWVERFDVMAPKALWDLTHPVATWILRWIAPLVFAGKAEAQFFRNHLGNPVEMSSAKIVSELGMAFREPEQTIVDAMEDLIKWGHVKKSKGE